MATTFKINYAANATPIEAIQATDTSNVASIVHSSIDKSFGGNKLLSCGTTSTHVKYKDYTTTDAYVTLEHANIMNDAGINCDFILVKIREAGSSGTPDVVISLNASTDHIKLQNIGDVCLLPLANVAGETIAFKSSGATELSKVDILIGEVE